MVNPSAFDLRGLSQLVAALDRLRRLAAVFDYQCSGLTRREIAAAAAVPATDIDVWLSDTSAVAVVSDACYRVAEAAPEFVDLDHAFRAAVLADLWQQLGGSPEPFSDDEDDSWTEDE